MKNVVLPESPYGIWTTRSAPSPAPPASADSSAYVDARPSTFGTLGTPASLPSWVVTIFESIRCRSAAGGCAMVSPASAASCSLSSSNMTKTARPSLPCLPNHSTVSAWLSR